MIEYSMQEHFGRAFNAIVKEGTKQQGSFEKVTAIWERISVNKYEPVSYIESIINIAEIADNNLRLAIYDMNKEWKAISRSILNDDKRFVIYGY